MCETPEGKRTPSFVDLRQFVRGSLPHVTVPGGRASGEDQFLVNRRLLALPPGPVSIGAIELDSGAGSVGSQPQDEFLIVCSGAIALATHDKAVVLNAGQAAVIQQGCSFHWNTRGPASAAFMRYAGSAPSARSIVAISQAPPMNPSNPPAAELLIGPTPECHSHVDHRSADGIFSCGTWASTPYQRRAMQYRHHELMHLLQGSVTFQDEAGRRETFSAGDIFLVEQHATCSWHSHEEVVKVYAVYKP